MTGGADFWEPVPGQGPETGLEKHKAQGGWGRSSAALAAQFCAGSYCPSVLWQLRVLYDSLPVSPGR